MHEDVNLVQRRPSPRPEDPEEEARFERLPDWQASAIAWDRYLERNKSIIVSLFQGQYRSRLTCLTCKQVSLCGWMDGWESIMYSLFLFIRRRQHTTHSCRYLCRYPRATRPYRFIIAWMHL